MIFSILGIRSYLNKPQLPYLRLPKIQSIKRNEIVTFNWPRKNLASQSCSGCGNGWLVRYISKMKGYLLI